MLYTEKKTTTLMYKNICHSSFPFMTRNIRNGKVRESRRLLKCTHRTRYESSVNCCFFILLLQDRYRATSGHRIILISTRFSNFASLVQGHLKALTHFCFYSLPYYRESHQLGFWSHLPPTRCSWTRLLSSMTPM